MQINHVTFTDNNSIFLWNTCCQTNSQLPTFNPKNAKEITSRSCISRNKQKKLNELFSNITTIDNSVMKVYRKIMELTERPEDRQTAIEASLYIASLMRKRDSKLPKIEKIVLENCVFDKKLEMRLGCFYATLFELELHNVSFEGKEIPSFHNFPFLYHLSITAYRR